MVYLVAACWVLCGVASAGFWFAYSQSRFPTLAVREWREDLGASLLLGLLFGPISLLVSFLLSGFGRHGWRLLPKEIRK